MVKLLLLFNCIWATARHCATSPSKEVLFTINFTFGFAYYKNYQLKIHIKTIKLKKKNRIIFQADFISNHEIITVALPTYELAHPVPGSICVFTLYAGYALQCRFTHRTQLTTLTGLLFCPQKPLSSLQGYFLVIMFNQSLKDIHSFCQTLAYEQQKKLMEKLRQD